MSTTDDLRAREAAALLPTYRRQPVAFVRGEGTTLYDADDRAYLDFLSGLSVTVLGHAHPAVTAAVCDQSARLVHVSNLFYTEPQVALAERLQRLLGWPDGKTFFCNSGAEANEAAIKLARRHGKRQHPDKVGVVALQGSFHGRTLAALLATGNPAKHEPFAPLGDWVTHVPHDDPDALVAAVDDRTCAVHVEVLQGEGGVRPVPAAVLGAARAACDRVGALLVVDEVQTGVGRLGSWFGFQSVPAGPAVTGPADPGPPDPAKADPAPAGPASSQPTPPATAAVRPDVVCLAKGLANGLPIGAIVARGEAAEAFAPGDHASTFGGGPVATAAALAVLDTIERDGLVEQAAKRGAQLSERLAALCAGQPLATGHRGRGLLQALLLAEPVAAAVVTRALDNGLVVNDVAADAIRLAPPLTVNEDELDRACDLLASALAEQP